jgi:hypothetical protein
MSDEWGALRALCKIIARADALDGPMKSEEIKEFVFSAIVELPSSAKLEADYYAPQIADQRSVVRHLLPRLRRHVGNEIANKRITSEQSKKILSHLEKFETESLGPSRGPSARKLFLRDLSQKVHDLTDYWMDKEVADIASAVLSCEIAAEHVRATMRETTRTARKAGGPRSSTR